MKKTIVTLVILLISGISSITAQQITNTENKKIVSHVFGNEYDVKVYNQEGYLIQEGHYFKIGERFKPHGIWKLYDHNTFVLVTTAEYDKGEQLWVETTIDGETIRVDQHDIEVNRLKTRIAALERLIEEQK